MKTKNRVLLIGVDTTKTLNRDNAGYDPAEIHRQSIIAKDNLTAMGYEAKWCYLDITSNDASEALTTELLTNQFDCILVGAGLRKRPDQLHLLEKLINIIHLNAIGAKICFNEDVHDTVETVKQSLKLN
jgi:short-subunit dehydrogenase